MHGQKNIQKVYICIKKKSGLNGVNGMTNHSISTTDMVDICQEQCLKRCFESRNHRNGSNIYYLYTKINEIYRIYNCYVCIYNSTLAGHTPYLSGMQHVLSFTIIIRHGKLINNFNHKLKANTIKIFLLWQKEAHKGLNDCQMFFCFSSSMVKWHNPTFPSISVSVYPSIYSVNRLIRNSIVFNSANNSCASFPFLTRTHTHTCASFYTNLCNNTLFTYES